MPPLGPGGQPRALPGRPGVIETPAAQATVHALAAYLGHHDPGFTLRTYVHLMPSADDRMRQAIDAVFASSDGPETARQGIR